MKKWLQLVIALLIVIGVGTAVTVSANQVSNDYRSAIADGQQDLTSGHYSDAMGDFAAALKSRPNNHDAQNLLHQTQFVVAGNQFYQQHQWSQAITQYQQAVELSAANKLTNLAQVGLANSKGLLKYYRQFVWNYNQALHLNQQGNFNASLEILNAKVINDPNSIKAPFKLIVNKARALQNANTNKQRSGAAVETIAKVTSNVNAPDVQEFDSKTNLTTSSSTNPNSQSSIQGSSSSSSSPFSSFSESSSSSSFSN